MRTYRHNRPFVAWLACVAIFLNTLGPAISHAMAKVKVQEATWVQICNTSGTKYIPLDLGIRSQENNQKPQPIAMEHCPYCLTHAGSFAIFTDVSSPTTQVILHYAYPPLFYQSPNRLFVWAPSSPRGPPVIS